MSRSLLLDGVLAEDPEAARAQVWGFDHATVPAEAGRQLAQLARRISEKVPTTQPLVGAITENFRGSPPSDPARHAREDGLILPIQPEHWRVAKLSRILNHFDLRFRSQPSGAELLDLCLEAEARAVALLKRLAGAKQAGATVSPFNGSSATDLTRYVLQRIFQELDAGFASKSVAEQERIADEIARRLADLPPDLRERIREDAGVTELSAAALKRTGAIAAVGGALVGTVGLAGFAAYTTLTSAIATAAGFVGLTLPFAVYIQATAALAFLSNPVVLAAATLLSGRFALSRAKQQMRDRLVPVMVATAVMASASDVPALDNTQLMTEIKRYFSMLGCADRKLAAEITNTFQCLPKCA